MLSHYHTSLRQRHIYEEVSYLILIFFAHKIRVILLQPSSRVNMDLSLFKFRICAPPRLNVSWHPTHPIIRLLGVDMTVAHLTRFLSYWTSRYSLAHKLELVKKLEAALLECHRFMILLSTINNRWKSGNLPSGTTGGRILYRRRLDDARDQGRKLWRYLLHFLQYCQRLALEKSGNKETEGWIEAGVEREIEGEIFFIVFYDDYLYCPPSDSYDIERLLLRFDCWNGDCKTWIDAADALSRRTVSKPLVGYSNPWTRPQGQQTLPVTQTTTTRPQNSSGLSQVDVSEQTADDFPPVRPPTSSHLRSRPRPQSSLVIPPTTQLTLPIQNSYDFNPAAPPGQAGHVVPRLRPVSNSRLASARRATRKQRLRRIPPRSGYFTPRPGRLGRPIQPLSLGIYTTRQTPCTNQRSSGINRVKRPRQAPTIDLTASRPAPSPYSSSAAAGASGETAPPRPAPSIVVPSLHSTPCPYRLSTAAGASGETAPPRPAPSIVVPSLRPTPFPYRLSATAGASGETAHPRPAPSIVVPSLYSTPCPYRLSAAAGASGKTAPPRPTPSIVVPSLRPTPCPYRLSAATGASEETAPPRPAPSTVVPSIHSTPCPYRLSAARWASGEAATARPAPTNVAPPLRPAPRPCPPPPAEEPSKKDDSSGTKSPPRKQLNRLMREHFGVDLTLPPEERVYPEHLFINVKGDHKLRPDKFPCLYDTAKRPGGEIRPPKPASTIVAPSLRPRPITRSASAARGAHEEVAPPGQAPSRQITPRKTPPRPTPTIVAPPLPPAQSTCSPCSSGTAGREDGALGTPEQRIITTPDSRPVQPASAVEIIDLEGNSDD